MDEAQDITSIYYELICKIYKDNVTKDAKICIMGDRYQSIYDFMKADERYISKDHKEGKRVSTIPDVTC